MRKTVDKAAQFKKGYLCGPKLIGMTSVASYLLGTP